MGLIKELQNNKFAGGTWQGKKTYHDLEKKIE